MKRSGRSLYPVDGMLGVSSRIRTLMMGTEMVPETSVSSCNQLTRLCAREDFIGFSHREIFKLYKVMMMFDKMFCFISDFTIRNF
jgi:hypothetical protein